MKIRILLSICMVMLFVQCKSWKKSERGAAIGGAAGAGVGAVIGNQSGNTVVGAIIGAAVGGTAGALIGNYMDKQEAEMERDLEGAKVERIGEGIKITFDSGLLFGVDSYSLNEAAKDNLKKMADIVNKYDDTEILIEGHTDNTGSNEHNKTLSEKRAESVRAYLKSYDVLGSRMSAVGYGEVQPLADNTTDAGKAQNRRVDVAVMANKKLKKAAENGTIGQVK